MQSALATTTPIEQNPTMMRAPSNPLATVYTVGAHRLTLEG